MSVPLDRLYNFLHDVCNHRDLIIYRFFPHGSRKITDLTSLYKSELISKYVLEDSLNFLFFHDQEPLNFDLYQSYDINQLEPFPLFTDELNEKRKAIALRIMPEMNLKWAVGLTLWRCPVLLVHSEKRSKELIKYQNIQFVGVYWWCHAIIARDWFRYAEHDLTLQQSAPTKEFLMYNRAWTGSREYRLKFTELLVENNISKDCMTWFSPSDDGEHYTQHQFKNPALQIKNFNLENYFAHPQVDSTASADYCSTDYQLTKIEIVLETLFDDDRLHLTEKTLRPIACGHPFMLVSTHGSLEYLKSYGVETFSPWINETYDTIEDPAQRLEAIVQEMKRIANLSKDEKTLLYAGLKAISDRNKKLFFSDAWQKRIVDEYKTNFNQAVKQLNQF
jgi:hypothetical protein